MRLLIAVCLAFAGLAPAAAQERPNSAEDKAARSELRRVRERFLAAIEASDIDAALEHLHEDVVIVWHDGVISKGREQVRQYLEKRLTAQGADVLKLSMQLEAAEQPILFDDGAAVSFGSAASHFQMRRRGALDVSGPWTATFAREGDRWRVASLHVSAGLYDNPLLERARTSATWGGVLAGAIGAGVGAALHAWLRRSRVVWRRR